MNTDYKHLYSVQIPCNVTFTKSYFGNKICEKIKLFTEAFFFLEHMCVLRYIE
jgi:hypothetical protein